MKTLLINSAFIENFLRKTSKNYDKKIAEDTQDEIAQEFSKIGLEDYSNLKDVFGEGEFNSSDYAEALKKIGNMCLPHNYPISSIERN